jgi:hypothetical protein
MYDKRNRFLLFYHFEWNINFPRETKNSGPILLEKHRDSRLGDQVLAERKKLGYISLCERRITQISIAFNR